MKYISNLKWKVICLKEKMHHSSIKFYPFCSQTRAMFEGDVYSLRFISGRTKIESGLKKVIKAMEIGPDKGLKKVKFIVI